MKTQPYELGSVRRKRAWQAIAELLNLHITIVKAAYFDRYCTGIQSSDFMDLVKRGEITRDEIVEAADDFMEVPISELDRREVKADEAARENDDSDLIHYQLKQIIEVGDEIVSDETKTFLSGGQYQTKGKKYRVLELSDYRDGLSGFTAITNADLKGERIWWSHYGVKSLWRNGVEVWNWHIAYLEQFKKQNPGHPQTEDMIKQCMNGAEADRIGERLI